MAKVLSTKIKVGSRWASRQGTGEVVVKRDRHPFYSVQRVSGGRKTKTHKLHVGTLLRCFEEITT
jgi:hypothetical protein